ncbi:hypothetical protein [Rufibacter psychrotolerans]|uniref:hypothetical protein n=1 Tax=Rufibacter psychrotolerans TaxID=2812556 RepID=UPI0019674BCB|nr:hypothetical protein [Rufibacter sp. SYSU D00308]
MKAEEKVLKAIYGLVKGDASPVHLPVSPVGVSQKTGLPLERVLQCCKVLENHGYLMSSRVGAASTYYYITKQGIAEVQKPKLSLYFFSTMAPARRRA